MAGETSASRTTDAPDMRTGNVLGLPVSLLDAAGVLECVFAWARERRSGTVCLSNVHSIVTARQRPEHALALRSADLVIADGAPIAWVLRRAGYPGQARLSGPDLMWACCRKAAAYGIPIFLYGATSATLQRLSQRLRDAFPKIVIAGAIAPPFRDLTFDEDATMVSAINASGAAIVWVGLGCPKQEAWMNTHRGRVQAVMIGVGAAFDFHAGVVNRAPPWMQRRGLEWLHRIFQDPRRLAKRYLVSNTLFMAAVLREALLPRVRAGHG